MRIIEKRMPTANPWFKNGVTVTNVQLSLVDTHLKA